jgi:long-chain acyl-CoA synthetase
MASEDVDADRMPLLEGIIKISDYSLVLSRTEKLTFAREHLNEMFGQKYPKFFRKEHVHYHKDTAEELAMINYTSGTTGYSKGVMLPYRALWSNLDFMSVAIGSHIKHGSNVVGILPMEHMYGLLVEFIFEFCFGNHIHFLTRQPSPTYLAEAFSEIKPAIIISVPLIVEKIIRKKIFPIVQTNKVKLLMNMPVINKKVKAKICELVKEAFGGNMYEVMVGGAGLNKEVEDFLTNINFPITMGYGTTETAPMITFSDWTNFIPGSCGTAVTNMEVKILSSDPKTIPGEIITKGLNVMTGYYKNEDATKAVIDENGWYHTGDLGTMDESGHVFINGRIKNMLLSSNGQNIYPEEIENKLNSMTMVNESIVIQNDGKLVGLVHPDFEEAESMGFNNDDLEHIMEENRLVINSQLPSFCKLSAIKLHEKEFEKTPKKSIKRYLYQNV